MTPQLIIVLLGVVCLSIGAAIDLQLGGGTRDAGFLNTFLGQGRRLFANHFYTRSDVYFHSGYYPSMFDEAKVEENHLAQRAGTREKSQAEPAHKHSEQCSHGDDHNHDHGKACDHEHGKDCDHDHGHADEKGAAKCSHDHGDDAHEHGEGCGHDHDFLGKPKDFMDRFRRNFIVAEHTHLTEKGTNSAREILPWLKLAAQLDPKKVDSYTVGAYWLRDLGRHKEAELFLREGLRANPQSYELLFELGRSAFDRNDMPQARNLWELAFQRWREQENSKPVDQQNRFMAAQILNQMARLEARCGNRAKAADWLTIVRKVSPNPTEIDRRIAEVLEGKLLDAP